MVGKGILIKATQKYTLVLNLSTAKLDKLTVSDTVFKHRNHYLDIVNISLLKEYQSLKDESVYTVAGQTKHPLTGETIYFVVKNNALPDMRMKAAWNNLDNNCYGRYMTISEMIKLKINPINVAIATTENKQAVIHKCERALPRLKAEPVLNISGELDCLFVIPQEQIVITKEPKRDKLLIKSIIRVPVLTDTILIKGNYKEVNFNLNYEPNTNTNIVYQLDDDSIKKIRLTGKIEKLVGINFPAAEINEANLLLNCWDDIPCESINIKTMPKEVVNSFNACEDQPHLDIFKEMIMGAENIQNSFYGVEGEWHLGENCKVCYLPNFPHMERVVVDNSDTKIVHTIRTYNAQCLEPIEISLPENYKHRIVSVFFYENRPDGKNEIFDKDKIDHYNAKANMFNQEPLTYHKYGQVIFDRRWLIRAMDYFKTISDDKWNSAIEETFNCGDSCLSIDGVKVMMDLPILRGSKFQKLSDTVYIGLQSYNRLYIINTDKEAVLNNTGIQELSKNEPYSHDLIPPVFEFEKDKIPLKSLVISIPPQTMIVEADNNTKVEINIDSEYLTLTEIKI